MSNGIPTGKTYLGFALLWGTVFPMVGLLCIALFADGQIIAGILVILLTSYAFFRHNSAIARRAQQIVRRPSPELRRILALDRQRRAIEGTPSRRDMPPPRNPHMAIAKVGGLLYAALLALTLLSLAGGYPVMLVYLIPLTLVFIAGMARLLWQAYRWRRPDDASI